MFGFFQKKEVHAEQIKTFHDAIKAINIYMFTKEWERGFRALSEIKEKEKISLNDLLLSVNDERIKASERIRYEKNSKILDALEKKMKAKEQVYQEKMTAERFDMKFAKIKEQVTLLSKTHRHQDAMNLLSSFLEENSGKKSVVSFYNKEKKNILKRLEAERLTEEKRMKKNTRLEAMKLIGATMTNDTKQKDVKDEKKPKKDEEKENPVGKIYSFYKSILDRRRRRELIDEVSALIDSHNEVEQNIAKSKLEKVHQGLIKELAVDNLIGYDFYGKILGADKISGDTFGFNEKKEKYNFFLGDATGHGVRAGLIISLLNRLFYKLTGEEDFAKLAMEINNGLKQDLLSKNFVTGVFFEINKENPKAIRLIGMGHEPMLLFKARSLTVEPVSPGGLAAGIRMISDTSKVRIKDIEMENEDMLICYSDGVLEAKNINGELYGIKRLTDIFKQICSYEKNISEVYNALIKDVKFFRGGTHFDDDLSIIVLKRDTKKDIIHNTETDIEEIMTRNGLSRRDIKRVIGKTREEAEEEIERLKREKETKNIIKSLEGLYYTGEILKLKQEAIRFIKDGYIDKKINNYLKLAINNENKYKIDQANRRMDSKYTVLKELMKKGDFSTIIKECNEIIAKDGNL